MSSASAAPQQPLTDGVGVSAQGLAHLRSAAERDGASARIAGLPHRGRYAFLVTLDTRSTATAYAQNRSAGVGTAKAAAKAQLNTVTLAQNAVIGRLPHGSRVLYRMHAAAAGVAVVTDVSNFDALRGLRGVRAVYPIAPKTASNSYAVPLQGAPQAWTAYGDLGAGSTVAIIDTGVDYTHADLGGEGTVAAFKAAQADQGRDDVDFPGTKVIGGYDFAGDGYNADPNSATYNPVPSPDAYPLDCNGHGSHVAGTVAGYGENADGSTYTGSYDNSTPFASMKIGPGMAPKAKLYAFRVFGCDGSTDLVGDAIDRALDPNDDGDISDHVDVANLSLGSDFGSPQDGDSVAVEGATRAGVEMVVASGNANDLYDVGGSPGDAPSALTVAASTDSYAQLDALNLTAPTTDSYGAERSIAYDWADDPDLSGSVARVTDPSNLDGCSTLNASDAAAVSGKIAFVEWTDDSGNRRCGSAARAAKLAAAGATGFIFADDSETFSAGITGSAAIPGVLVTKSGGDAIRSALEADTPVTVGSTTASGFRQVIPNGARDDMVTGFSSRGIGDAGNVKPDVTAVGESVYSVGSGTGSDGANDSGTSMATPMVAGAAALVRSAHPDWSPEQVKADLMNTAGQDLYTGTGHTGDKYGPQRVGSGRLDVKAALDNGVLAYNAEDHGSVSASFGPVETSQPMTLTKTVKVQNTTTSTTTYDVTYDARTTAPGADVSVSPSSVTLDPRSSTIVTVTLTVDPSQLTKTHDPTVDLTQGGLPRVYQSDVSGNLLLTPTGSAPQLRVPVYAAPRAASTMTQPASMTLPAGASQSTLLPLTGGQVNSGSGDTKVQSTVAGFELQAVDGSAPTCTDTVTSGCVSFEDQRSADLRYVGTTSDAPQLRANGQDPLSDGMAYFAVNTQGPWRTASGMQEFDVSIDTNGDGVADAVLYNTRLSGTDVLVSQLVDLDTGDVLDAEPINAALGDTDTALLHSDTLVLPVAIAALPGIDADHSRISYGISSYTPYSGDPIDTIGMDATGALSDPLSMDVLHPGVSVAGSYTGDASPLLFPDSEASVLKLTRDPASYAADNGKGALLVHFQNAVGDKAQVVRLNAAATVGLSLAPTTAARGQTVTATVTIPKDAGPGATGAVTLTAGGTQVASGTAVDGTATLTFSSAKAGKLPVVASYAGDENYQPGVSAPATLTVTKSASTVKLVAPKTLVHGRFATATVSVATVAGIAPTGTVRLMSGTKVLGKATLTGGTARIKFTSAAKGTLTLVASYAGDSNYLAGKSAQVRVVVT
ncbi:S8 family serine peptidase [Nocardioides maradonensis]